MRLTSPAKFLRWQRCLVCDSYGCGVRKLIQDEGLAGDNLLPLCPEHLHEPLLVLYSYEKIRQWLHEHERIDIVLYLETRMKAVRK